MNKEILKQIFLQHNLEGVKFIKKINIGFTNTIYSINDNFILKICKKISNEKNFEKEVFFYSFFKDKIIFPKIIVYDKSKKLYNKNFIIYNKIQ